MAIYFAGLRKLYSYLYKTLRKTYPARKELEPLHKMTGQTGYISSHLLAKHGLIILPANLNKITCRQSQLVLYLVFKIFLVVPWSLGE